VLSFLANIETKWMKAEIKGEAKELRKLKREVEDLLSKEKNEKAAVPMPSSAGADGL
jgi:cell division protein FtsL